MDILSAATMLFLIMDPLGNLPIVLSILKHIDPKRRRKVLIRELIFALLILMLFLFAGQSILSFLHVQPETLSISGGIILFIIAIKMIFPSAGSITGLAAGEEPFIVPMAIPMIAGPSVIAALLLLSSQHPDKLVELSASVVIAWGATFFILMFYGFFNRLLGERGLKAVERLMGLLLVMISTQMFLDGVKKLFGINQRQQKAAPVSGFLYGDVYIMCLRRMSSRAKIPKNQNGVLFPTAHLNLISKCTNEDCHLQTVHDEQEGCHDVQRNRSITWKWHHNIQNQNQPNKGNRRFS